jgi:hypothetical protein
MIVDRGIFCLEAQLALTNIGTGKAPVLVPGTPGILGKFDIIIDASDDLPL